MFTDSLSTLLKEAQEKTHQHLYVDALRIIREARIFDLRNLYISSLEHFVAKLSYLAPLESKSETILENDRILSLIIERAVKDGEQRSMKRAETFPLPDELTLGIEKIKNRYFFRTDEFLERKEYERALEEIRRIYIYDAPNIVAKEYEQKIEQLIQLSKTVH